MGKMIQILIFSTAFAGLSWCATNQERVKDAYKKLGENELDLVQARDIASVAIASNNIDIKNDALAANLEKLEACNNRLNECTKTIVSTSKQGILSYIFEKLWHWILGLGIGFAIGYILGIKK